MFGDHFRNPGRRQNARAMCARGDPEWAVGGVAIIQMQADGEKSVQDESGGACEVDALLDGREFESPLSHFSCERKHQVLMPGYFPVGRRGFIECDRLDGNG